MAMQKNRSSLRFYTVIISLTIVLAILLTIFVALRSYNSQKSFLKQRVASLAVALSSSDMASLTATEEDLGTPAYQTIKTQFQDIATANPDIEFIYATKLLDDKVYFIGDSEPEGSEDESPAGQSYDEVDAQFKSVHLTGKTIVIGPTKDRWGTWFSGVAPLVYDGSIIGVLGMDIASSDLMSNVVLSGLVVALPSILIVLLLVIARSRARQGQKLAQDKMALLSLLVVSVKTPLEGIRNATKQIQTRSTADQEVILLSKNLLLSVDRVVQSIDDAITATEQAGAKSILNYERVDIVAMVIDIVEEYKLNATTRHVALLMGNSWPINHVVDTDPKEFKRALTSLLAFVVSKAAQDSRITLSYVAEDGFWKIVLYDRGVSIDDDSRAQLAVPELIFKQLGGSFEVKLSPTETLYIISFKLTGNEITH